MRALILVHRWLSIPVCLLFAMWFASGIVMHFVPFPALTEAERFEGLPIIDVSKVRHSPAEAVAASMLKGVTRVRLWQRSDGPVYLVSAASGTKALHADDLRAADIGTDQVALAIATEHARLRGLNPAAVSLVDLADHDQWTVPNGLDRHRPLYRIALNDHAGTELYVSSRTGEVARDTTYRERAWNYVGSVAHWIYPTALRKNWMAWHVAVWWLSLAAVIVALSGLIVGLLRFRRMRGRIVSPFRKWHAWHHWFGLACAAFVTTWIVSGWLSMDHGRLFSTGALTRSEADRIAGMPAWGELTSRASEAVSPAAREIEWFAFGGRIFQRRRTGVDAQQLSVVVPGPAAPFSSFLQADQVNAVISRAVGGCSSTEVVARDDKYLTASEIASAPVYRSICGDVWYQIDGANGANLEKLDAQRRTYRWLYRALHTFDLPALMARPSLRTAVIVLLCGFGVAFSITGIVIAWRRLRLAFR
ncbi:PepSY domain-containing protein [Bradyrhizobium roseum]|uniref:PepSY domain-containing protein n=1 Tax=Bradyrhizobium roseum TaxID=3056648 RepID=UPI002A4E13EF|nr:PepSY domain-containing protein [Bradyrhizobium roseus]